MYCDKLLKFTHIQKKSKLCLILSSEHNYRFESPRPCRLGIGFVLAVEWSPPSRHSKYFVAITFATGAPIRDHKNVSRNSRWQFFGGPSLLKIITGFKPTAAQSSHGGPLHRALLSMGVSPIFRAWDPAESNLGQFKFLDVILPSYALLLFGPVVIIYYLDCCFATNTRRIFIRAQLCLSNVSAFLCQY